MASRPLNDDEVVTEMNKMVGHLLQPPFTELDLTWTVYGL
jgi:hypothetical protein